MNNANDEPASIVYEPSEAAERLGVSASGLRRLAPIYESVFGELKRTGKGDEDKRSREWPSEAISHLLTARALTGRGKPYRTIETALQAIRQGVVTDTSEIQLEGRQYASEGATGEALHMLIEEVKYLRSEIQELKESRVLPTETGEIEKDSVESITGNETQNGFLVRFAIWIENRVKGF